MLPSGTNRTISGAVVSAEHAAPQPTRLDIFQLEDSVSEYLARSLTPATLRTYGSGQRRYLAFCTAANLPPMPITEHTLCTFAAHLAKDGLSHQTIKSYLSAIRHYHILAGQGDPFA